MDLQENTGTLLINMNESCNIDCIYCRRNDFIKSEQGSFVKPLDFESFKKSIESTSLHKDSKINFSGGGEPTCCPSLDKYIAYAYEKGYRKITLETNGIKFSDEKYLTNLMNAGLNSCIISLPSLNAESYEEITDSKGSFSLIKSAFANINKLNLEIEMILITLTRQNFKDMIRTVSGLKHICRSFSFFHARPNYADKDMRNFIVKYSELKPYMIELFKYAESEKLSISNGAGAGAIPSCFFDEFLDKSNTVQTYDLGNLPEIHETSRCFIYSCKNCKLFASCPGIPINYLNIYDFSEFKAKLD